MKRALFGLGALLVAAVAVAYMSYRMTANSIAHAQVTAQPFVSEQLIVAYDEDPAGKVLGKRMIAMRPDGSKVTVEPLLRYPNAGVTRRLEFADGRATTFIGFIQSKTRALLSPKELALRKERLRNLPSNCAWPGSTDTFVRTEAIHGTTAMVVQTANPGAASRWTQWRLPNSLCTAVSSLAERRRPDGTWQKVTEYRTIYLTAAEPDPVLFEDSEQYKEMPPSQAKKEFLTAMGVTEAACPECFRNNWANKDLKYYQMRP